MLLIMTRKYKTTRETIKPTYTNRKLTRQTRLKEKGKETKTCEQPYFSKWRKVCFKQKEFSKVEKSGGFWLFRQHFLYQKLNTSTNILRYF